MLPLTSHALAKHAQKLGCGVDGRRRGKVGGLCGLHRLREPWGLHGLRGLHQAARGRGLWLVECTFRSSSFFRCSGIIFRLNIFIFCRIILNILDFFNGYFLNLRHFIYSIFLF